MADQPASPSVLAWFARLLAGRRALCAGVVAAMIVQLGFQLGVALGLQVIIDEAIPRRDPALLGRVLLALAAAFATGLLAGIWQSRATARLASGVLYELSTRLFERVVRMSAGSRRELPAADVLTRFTTDLKAVEHALQSVVPVAAQSAVLAAGGWTAVLAVEWRIALAAVVGSPIVLAAAHALSPRIAQASAEFASSQARSTAVVEESLGAEQVVPAFGMEPVFDERFAREARGVESAGTRVAFLSQALGIGSEYGITLLVVTIIGIGAALAIAGNMTTGSLVACCSLLLNTGWAASALADALAGLTKLGGSVARLDEIERRAGPLPEPADAVEVPPLSRSLRFEDVRFGYGERVVLDGVSLEIAARSWVAFVGPSGSSKSSVLRLLLRFEDPWSGRITWDGVPLDHLRLGSLRRHMGLVPQEPVLFDWTLRENVRLGDPGADDAAVVAAAADAEMHAVIEALPQGYDTSAGPRGGHLSGGQRQRLAIARALVRRPAVLMLDEATSALDAETEAKINATLERLARGRTTVSVTHRLESVRRADRIFVLDAGRVVEQGTHDELLALGGRYRTLWDKQSGFTEASDGRVLVTAERLQQVPLLSTLSPELLDPLTAAFATEHYETDQVIFREGARGDRFLIVVRGRVEVERDGVRLGVLLDGDHFGEIALLGGGRRTATVTARAPTVCLSLSRQHFWQLLLPHEDVREALSLRSRERMAALDALDRARGGAGVSLDPDITIM